MRRLILLAALLSLAAAVVCPTGYDLVRNGECYREIVEDHMEHSPTGPGDAKKRCAQDKALPIIIRNQEDQDYWVSVSKKNREKGGVYGYTLLGLECNNNYRWQWADGSKITFRPAGDYAELDQECENDPWDPWSYGCMWFINPDTEQWANTCGGWNSHDVDLYCVFVPQTTHDDPDPDCDNFSYDDGDDLCFQVAKSASNFTEARSMCSGFGATLASIHNDRENNFVRRIGVSKGMITPIMLGAKYDSSTNTTKWEDGSAVDYTNFAPGFPSTGSGECLALQTIDGAGRWMNVDCTEVHPFACVRKTDAKPVCNGTHKEGDIIYSPGFPSSASEPCQFVLTVDPGKLVEVEILMLEANSCCDRLVLTEGTLGGNAIATLTGEQYTGKTFRTTGQNSMGVSWQPQGGVNVRGMMITFHGVPK